MSRNRVYAIIAVAILHALLAYAFVTGLAYKFVKNVSEDLKTFDVTEEPPPPPEEPPPPEPASAPPIVAPPAIVRTNTPAPVIQTVINAPPPVITPQAAPA
ncbi:MAG TPA: energy transducer TonB, partial [Allosphingosinicella sp.]